MKWNCSQQRAYFNGVEYYLPYLYPEGATLLDYLPEETAVILDEPEHIAHAFHRFREGLAQVDTEPPQSRRTAARRRIRSTCRWPTGWPRLARFPEVGHQPAAARRRCQLHRSAGEEHRAAGRRAGATCNAPPRRAALLDGALVDLACQTPVNYALVTDQLHGGLAALAARRLCGGGGHAPGAPAGGNVHRHGTADHLRRRGAAETCGTSARRA